MHGRVWVDRVETVKLILPGNRQFVAQTQIQRQPRSDFPIVLRIKRVKSAVAIVVAHAIGYRELLVGAQQEVRHRIAVGCGPAAGTLPVKGKRGRSQERLEERQIHDFSAELQRMSAEDPTEVILNLIRVGDEFHRPAGIEVKPPGYTELQTAAIGVNGHVRDSQISRSACLEGCIERV